MKKVFSIAIALIACQTSFAQALQLKGLIMSSGKQPVEFANVILRENDSVFVTGGITDDKGRFSMYNLKKGVYDLQISCLGYRTKTLSLNNLIKSTDVGIIEMDTMAVALGEVVVTAANVINKVDRKVILPSASQMKASTNGFDLLQQLHLSRIDIDVLKNTVSAAGGGEVQLRINGVKASVQEIRSIRPEDIIRIEHYEDPGPRYENAEAVIDYITRRRNSGGFVSVDLSNSLQMPFGDNSFNAKINYNKSEFGVFYYGSFRNLNEMWRDNSETFNFSDGSSLTRIEKGIPDTWSMNWHYMHLNYSYQEPDKWFFNATLRTNINDEPKVNYRSMLYAADAPQQSVDMIDYSSSRMHIPSLDLYFQSKLKNGQFLVFNVVGTYIDTETKRYYSETRGEDILTELLNNVDGDKYSLIGEGIYEREFKSGRLSLGLKHTQSFTDNTYSGTTVAETGMNQTETYLYAEFQGKLNKFSYSLGVGETRSWLSERGEGYQNYTFRPTISLKYKLSENSSLRYRANMYSSAPSLSDLGNVEQIIDSLQVRRGNSALKPVMMYTHSLNYDIKKGIFNGSLYIGHRYYHNPIMERTLIENDLFVRTMANQKSWQKLNTEAEFSVRPLKDHLNLKLVAGMNYFDSKGIDYHHTYTNWYYRGSVNASYQDWSLSFDIKKGSNDFYGETLTYNESFHALGIMYKHKQLSLGATTFNPFTSLWKSGSDNLSALGSSRKRIYVDGFSKLVVFKVSYNFDFGRKLKSVEKRLNNEDKDSGVMNGGK
ncbi:outer membrane beta-barrel protein [uncultured Bacteroides sp.]|uniref:TonB-dependent receptor n=1 Tax=uncultured Bacteroides sp. TaxID=162156 RepID=UPI002AA63D11|nr:carboxypeptidase-like regulatory domain-containing protein [uncultured Bacteroides sp.]